MNTDISGREKKESKVKGHHQLFALFLVVVAFYTES